MKPTVNYESCGILGGKIVAAQIYGGLYEALTGPLYDLDDWTFDQTIDRAFRYVMRRLCENDPWYLFSHDARLCLRCCAKQFLEDRPVEIGEPWLFVEDLTAVLALIPAIARQVFLHGDEGLGADGPTRIFDQLCYSIIKFREEGPDGRPPDCDTVKPCGHPIQVRV